MSTGYKEEISILATSIAMVSNVSCKAWMKIITGWKTQRCYLQLDKSGSSIHTQNVSGA